MVIYNNIVKSTPAITNLLKLIFFHYNYPIFWHFYTLLIYTITKNHSTQQEHGMASKKTPRLSILHGISLIEPDHKLVVGPGVVPSGAQKGSHAPEQVPDQ
jgi:hypothetical protein